LESQVTERKSARVWTKPELVRLGKIAEVAQQNPIGPQGGNKT
jgi:hypothetical protein